MKNNQIKYEVLQLTDKDDLAECINLLVNAFSFINNEIFKTSMEFFVNNDPNFKCIFIKDNNKVIALQCILDREMNFFGKSIKIAGMSYAAIEKKYQNSEVGKLLKNELFNYIKKNSHISLGFARKAMDNYWYPYGYRGITNFCEIKVSISKNSNFNFNYKTREAEEDDIKNLILWYNSSYNELLGPLARNFKIWKYYLKKIKLQKNNLLIIIENDFDIGYCLINKNYILELGYNQIYQNNIFKFLYQSFKNKNYNEIIFKTGINHPIINSIDRLEYTISKRYVWKGGHIAKITDVYFFLNNIKSILEKRLSNLNILKFKFSCNSIMFSYENSELKIEQGNFENPDIVFDNTEWVKLIFGVVSTKLIHGFNGNRYENVLNIMFPECNPQFPDLDHF